MKVKVKDYSLLQKVKDSGGFCLCTIEPTKCMCDEFNKATAGECECGVFVKEEGTD